MSAGSAAEVVGCCRTARVGGADGDAADGSGRSRADCPPELAGLPTTITVPAGRSVSPVICTDAATGLLAETSRSGWMPG